MFASLYDEGLFPLQAHVGHPEQPTLRSRSTTTCARCTARRAASASHAPCGSGASTPHRPGWCARSQASRSPSCGAAKGEVDLPISDLLEDPAVHARSFWTINHPTSALLDPLASRILERAGLAPITAPRAQSDEPLAGIRTPVEPHVTAALGSPPPMRRTGWSRGGAGRPTGSSSSSSRGTRPVVVRQGLERHGARMERLGLL